MLHHILKRSNFWFVTNTFVNCCIICYLSESVHYLCAAAGAGAGVNLLYYIKAISKTRWLNFAIGPAVVLMATHGFSLTCCQETHISMPFRTCILAWNNTYCIISRWTSSGNTPQLSRKAFCICQPSTSHNYLAVGTQRVMGSRLMDTQAFWFLIVIVILSTWGLGNASFEPPSSAHSTSLLLLRWRCGVFNGCPLLARV